MLLKTLTNSFDGMRGENQFLRIAAAALLVSNLVVSCSAMNRDEVVTLVPPTLTEKTWLSKTQAAGEYTEAWALYIAMMIGNVNPHNATVVKDAIGPILDKAIYQETMTVLDKQIHQIRQDRVSLNFEPQKVLRDNVNPNKFYVTGRSISEGPAGDKKRSNRTYEIELTIQDYRPNLTWVGTNTGDARTQDIIDREAAKERNQAEREARKAR
ncbi:TraE/TraK family type IV conjugative transfer system protein [Pseudomonas sp. 2FE]|uniref:TraE/TraK family type IV conjugative transfer system protein n=1 Tax=Pseudomonas sp. 2FE TaxID=2502190 RepID=UPI0010F6DEAB|nr:TraE/TraK family type IV conjugative transfer system protein [Pseudomonas sp. 2FE]